jgi:ketose-bisphosphate aldolase
MTPSTVRSAIATLARTARARALVQRARAQRFAVGAFNADNLVTVRAVCRAASAMQAPALIEVSHREVEAIGLRNIRAIVDNEIDELGVEVYLNLDHAPTVDAVEAALDVGFEFVHLDLFQSNRDASDDDVVTATRAVVSLARRTGALVEGEPRYVPGSSTWHRHDPEPEEIAASRSDPVAARAFVAATGVDVFAVGIGNVHGRYAHPPRLDLALLERVHAAVDGGLSMHGASGFTDAQYRAVVRRGAVKINVNSDLRALYRSALETEYMTHPDELSDARLLAPVANAVQRLVESRMRVFGSAGQAVVAPAR